MNPTIPIPPAPPLLRWARRARRGADSWGVQEFTADGFAVVGPVELYSERLEHWLTSALALQNTREAIFALVYEDGRIDLFSVSGDPLAECFGLTSSNGADFDLKTGFAAEHLPTLQDRLLLARFRQLRPTGAWRSPQQNLWPSAYRFVRSTPANPVPPCDPVPGWSDWIPRRRVRALQDLEASARRSDPTVCYRRPAPLDFRRKFGGKQFAADVGHWAWALAGVRADLSDAGPALAELLPERTWLPDTAARRVPGEADAWFAFQFVGSAWTLFLLSVGGPRPPLEVALHCAKAWSVRWSPAFAYLAEDTSGCETVELFENGRSISLHGDTAAGAPRKSGPAGRREIEAVWKRLHVFLPNCYIEDDGHSSRLILSGVPEDALARVDAFVNSTFPEGPG